MDPIGVALTSISEELTEIRKLLQESTMQFPLVQEQMRIIERQLDSISAKTDKAYVGTIDPSVRKAEIEKGIKAAEKAVEEEEAIIDRILRERAARGVPNDGDAVLPEDLEREGWR